MRRMRAITSASGILTIAALTGCGVDSAGRRGADVPAFREWESEGVRFVESSSEVLDIMLPWRVDSIPNLELGGIDASGPTLFNRIAGVVVLPGGQFVVLDGATRELRWFDATGEHVRTTGGQGQGPGEFQRPMFVSQFNLDSILVFDATQRDFTWLALDGAGLRTSRASGEDAQLFLGTPRAAAGSRVLFRSSSETVGQCAPNVACAVPLDFRWVNVTTSEVDTLDVSHVSQLLEYTGSGPMLQIVTGPLDQRGIAVAAPLGPVVEGDPSFELKQFDTDGTLVALYRVASPARVAPRDAIELRLELSSAPDEVRQMFDLIPLPEVVPAFQALHVDNLGWYWAELFQIASDAPSEWLVFDPEGRAHGVVELPKDLEVYEIREDFVVGRWVNELGVEHIRRYSIDRVGET